MTIEHIKIDRDTMINHLTASMFDALEQDDVYLETLIAQGFKGFNNYTDDELIQEYRDYISEDETYPLIIELIKE
jgi:hypothetical protein